MTSLVHIESRLKQINADLNAAYLVEEDFWKQRSRQNWLSLGDRNSGYFHAITKGRSCINTLAVLETDQGVKIFEEYQIAAVIAKSFQDLFTFSLSDLPGLSSIVKQAILPSISEEMNVQLIRDPSPPGNKGSSV